MSDEAPPFDQLDEKPIWRDGFDVQTTISKGALLYHPLRRANLVLLGLGIGLGLSAYVSTQVGLGLAVFYLVWVIVRGRRRWRLRGNARQLTISKTLGGKLGWGRRDFMWGEIQGFGTSIGADGYADVTVETRRDDHSLNFEMSPDDAEELAEALTKMRIRAKMDTLARSGSSA